MPKPLLVLLALLLLVSGCQSLSLRGSPATNMKQAIDQQDFLTAHYILTHLSPDHPEYTQVHSQQTQLDAAISDWETRIGEQITTLMQQENWTQAYTLIEQAQQRWPNSLVLEKTTLAVQSRERTLIETLRYQVLLAEGQARLAMQAPLERLAMTTATGASEELALQEERTLKITSDMTSLAKKYRGERNWQETAQLLDIAQQLSPTQERQALLAEAHEHLRSQAQKKQARAAAKLQRQANQLLSDYRRSNAIADLIKAKHFIQGQQHSATLAEATGELNALINDRFQQNFTTGEQYYTQGQYQAAHAIWESIQPLKPHNRELANKLDRVKKVLETLEKLR